METRYLTRTKAAEYIRGQGLRYSAATLQKLATTGGGPVYRRFGNRAVYTTANLDEWIKHKLSAPTRSTSEVLTATGSAA